MIINLSPFRHKAKKSMPRLRLQVQRENIGAPVHPLEVALAGQGFRCEPLDPPNLVSCICQRPTVTITSRFTVPHVTPPQQVQNHQLVKGSFSRRVMTDDDSPAAAVHLCLDNEFEHVTRVESPMLSSEIDLETVMCGIKTLDPKTAEILHHSTAKKVDTTFDAMSCYVKIVRTRATTPSLAVQD